MVSALSHPSSPAPSANDGAWLSIRDAAARCGVSAATLRAWERRYGLLQPYRNAKGHRLYNQQHLQRVADILSCLNRGQAIDDIRQHLRSETFQATEQTREQTPEQTTGRPAELAGHARQTAATPSDIWHKLQQNLEHAATSFNSQRLHQHWQQALASYPLALYYRYCLAPVLLNLQAVQSQPPSNPGSKAQTDKNQPTETQTSLAQLFLQQQLCHFLQQRIHHHSDAIKGKNNTGQHILLCCLNADLSNRLGVLLRAFALMPFIRVTLMFNDLTPQQMSEACAQWAVTKLWLCDDSQLLNSDWLRHLHDSSLGNAPAHSNQPIKNQAKKHVEKITPPHSAWLAQRLSKSAMAEINAPLQRASTAVGFEHMSKHTGKHADKHANQAINKSESQPPARRLNRYWQQALKRCQQHGVEIWLSGCQGASKQHTETNTIQQLNGDLTQQIQTLQSHLSEQPWAQPEKTNKKNEKYTEGHHSEY